MCMMLQADDPGVYVVATGEAHSVCEFLEAAAERCEPDWKSVVETDPRYLRPTEVDYLDGEVFENPEDTSSLTA
jgi:GDPmannose 4,6-dehydratase